MPRRPNKSGLYLHDYVSALRPVFEAPMSAIVYEYNAAHTLLESRMLFETMFKKRATKLRRRYSATTAQKRLIKTLQKAAGKMYDRATPEGRAYLRQYLEPARRAAEEAYMASLPAVSPASMRVRWSVPLKFDGED